MKKGFDPILVRCAKVLMGICLVGTLGVTPVQAAPPPEDTITAIADDASNLPALRTLLISQHGKPILERSYQGANLDRPVNIKSASKTIIAALVGRAIHEGIISGVNASIRPLLMKRLPAEANPDLANITVEDLLTMRAGLEPTSGPNYDSWIVSRDWVADALSRPMVDVPGGRMLYSTGSSHLLSAILTDASGRSTRQLAQDWLGVPLDMQFGGWDRDPQGVYLGGNNMAISPRALLRFGEMMRHGGVAKGTRVIPKHYIDASWQPRTQSPFTGHHYGYGWFIAQSEGRPIYYAWGYGGQLLYVVPSLALTVVMTSDPTQPSGSNGYARELYGLLTERIMPLAAGQWLTQPPP